MNKDTKDGVTRMSESNDRTKFQSVDKGMKNRRRQFANQNIVDSERDRRK
jgi:hypothetical protein